MTSVGTKTKTFPSSPKTIGLGGIIVLPERLRALRPEVVAELAQSMAAQGQLQPIVLTPQERGSGFNLVAGRHRFEAAKQLKWETIQAIIFEGMDAAAAQLAEIDENLIRADLSPAERARHTAARKPLYVKLRPETKQGGTPGAGRGKGKKLEARQNGDLPFTKDTAKKTGKSERTVQRDAERGDKVKVLHQIAGTCLDKGEELDALAKLPASEQRTLAKAASKGKKVSAKTRLKQVKRAEREKELAAKTQAAAVALGVETPASVLLIDWALRFDVWSEKGEDRSAENHYPCGSVADMAALKPPMADDAVVFAWTTAPQLKNALEIFEAWGIEYKSFAGWDKEIAGTGYWARSQLELILIGTKGKVPAPAPGEQFPQVFRSRRRAHSQKPVEVYEAIERLYPTLIKLEMFARAPRSGWRSWGNEVQQAEAAE